MQVVNPLEIFKQRKTLYKANLEFEKKDDAPSGYKPFETCHTFDQAGPHKVKEWLKKHSTNSFVLYDPDNTAYTTCDTRKSYKNKSRLLYACADLPTAQAQHNIHTAMYVKITLKNRHRKREHMVVTLDNMARAHESTGRVFRLVDEHQIIENLQNVDQTRLLENQKIVCNPEAQKKNMPLYRLERFHNWNGKSKSLGLDLGQTKRYLEPDTGKRSRMSKIQVLFLDQGEDKLRKQFDLWYGRHTMADVLFVENELYNVPNLDPASLVAEWEFWIANKRSPNGFENLVPPTGIESKDIIKAWKVLVNVPKTVQSAAQLRHLRKNTSLRQRWVLAFLQDYLNIQPANPNQPKSTVLDLLLGRSLNPDSPEFITDSQLVRSHRVLAVVLTFADKEKIGLDFDSIFLESIEAQKMSALKLLFEAKNTRGQYLIDLSNIGERALQIAASAGDVEVVNLLIKAKNINKTGFRVNLAESDNEKDALEIAATNGHSEIVSLLLEAKTFDNTQFRFGQLERVRNQLLFYAGLLDHTKVVSLLLAAKTLGDKKEFRFRVFPGNRHHEIKFAAVGGNVELVTLLLRAKTIDETEFRFNSNYALDEAVKHNKPKVVALLLKAKNINNTEFRIMNARAEFPIRNARADLAIIAAQNGYTEIISLLLEAKTFDGRAFRFDMGREVDDIGENVPIIAASNGHADTLSLLLEARSFDETEFRFFNEVDDDRELNYNSIVTIARRGNKDTLSLLVEAKTFDKKDFRFGFKSMTKLITRIKKLDEPKILHMLLVAAVDRGQDIRRFVSSRYVTHLTGISKSKKKECNIDL